MKLIIVTGKSGSGKSEFSKILAEKLKAELISLDEISHLSLEDKNIKNQLLKIFGAEIFDETKINRKKLGNIVFNDAEKLEQLNTLSWKFIDDYIDKKISNTKSSFLILEYALISKMKYFKVASFKILVEANHKTRINRIMLRDNITESYALIRDKNSLNYNAEDFDYVIKNSSLKKAQLEAEAEKITKKIQI